MASLVLILLLAFDLPEIYAARGRSGQRQRLTAECEAAGGGGGLSEPSLFAMFCQCLYSTPNCCIYAAKSLFGAYLVQPLSSLALNGNERLSTMMGGFFFIARHAQVRTPLASPERFLSITQTCACRNSQGRPCPQKRLFRTFLRILRCL